MGRQSHVTRLALGRSPYGDPLRDENGDFVLGPNAHIHDGPGYLQRFDDRGHPQNESATIAARRLRKAQNDVLATVGVVVRNVEERKSRWERLPDEQKLEILLAENRRGVFLKGGDRTLGVVLPWAMVTFRRRLMTFDPYAAVAFTGVLAKERQSLGLSHLLFAGLPFHLLSSFPQLFRYHICEPDVEDLVDFSDSRAVKSPPTTLSEVIWTRISEMFLQCLEVPFLVHATLQSLSITPSTAALSWKSLIPFSAMSPITFGYFATTLTWKGIGMTLNSFLCSPVCLFLIRDRLQTEIGYRFYLLFRQLIPRPDRPDAMSIKSLDTSLVSQESQPPHSRSCEKHKGKRIFGPRSLMGALRFAFPPVYAFLNRLNKGRIARSRGRLTPLLDRQLRSMVRHRYWSERRDLPRVPRRGSEDDLGFRNYIVASVFKFANLDPYEELVDLAAWTNDVLGPKADVLMIQAPRTQSRTAEIERVSQGNSTRQERMINERYRERVSNLMAEAFRIIPSSDAVIIQASDGEVVMFSQQSSANTTNVADMNNIHTIQATEVPLEALIQGIRDMEPDAEQVHPSHDQPNTQISPPPLPQIEATHSPPSPPTPSPGITRARALTDPQIVAPSSTSTPTSPQLPILRPIRRPTETDTSLAAISENLRAEASGPQFQRRTSLHDMPTASPTTPQNDQQTLHETIANNNNDNNDDEGNNLSPPDPSLIPLKFRHYRTTTLSLFAADSLAWHASGLLTSLLLWPLEAVWLRAVAGWALQTPALAHCVDPWWAARLGFGVVGVGRPVTVLGLGTWFGGADSAAGRTRYVGSILLTLGLEGVIRGICWAGGVWWVQRSKDKYGWGQF